MTKLKCDFCSSQELFLSFLCRDFTDPLGIAKLQGAWAACAECAVLVDCGLWDELLAHSVETYPGNEFNSPAERAVLTLYIDALHKGFRENRI